MFLFEWTKFLTLKDMDVKLAMSKNLSKNLVSSEMITR